jgi:hypothetical protein
MNFEENENDLPTPIKPIQRASVRRIKFKDTYMDDENFNLDEDA